jgi:DNA-binding MarR family transcriptional regulator
MVLAEEPITRLFGFAAGLHIKSQRIAERELKAAGLTYAQFGVLAALAEKDGRTQRELADHLETDANTVMVICDGLERKGCVQRIADSADRRIWRICVTKAGASRFARAYAIVQGLYRPLSAIVTADQIRRALPVLEKLYAHVKERELDRGGRS